MPHLGLMYWPCLERSGPAPWPAPPRQLAQLVADSQTLTGTAFDPALLVSEGKYQDPTLAITTVARLRTASGITSKSRCRPWSSASSPSGSDDLRASGCARENPPTATPSLETMPRTRPCSPPWCAAPFSSSDRSSSCPIEPSSGALRNACSSFCADRRRSTHDERREPRGQAS